MELLLVNLLTFATRERLRKQGLDLPIFDPLNLEETARITQDLLHRIRTPGNTTL